MIPTIDFGAFQSEDLSVRQELAAKLRAACEDIGFFCLTGTEPWVPRKVVHEAWEASSAFFHRPREEKERLCRDQEEYPFGYTPFEGEVLQAGKAVETAGEVTARPDLKEMFSIGPADSEAGFPPRLWPECPQDFAESWSAYYDAMQDLAAAILRAFALALRLPEDFFVRFTGHHASALRALNYPACQPKEGQLRASAHTDYGVITILKCGAPGLQVSKDSSNPKWIDVPFMEERYV